MTHPDSAIIVFAKNPIPGQVKTRLIPSLSAAEAAQLQAMLIHRTLSTATRQPLCPVYLYCAPNPDDPFFERCRLQYNVSLKQQNGRDLGQRMFNAFEEILSMHASALLIGTDCPAFKVQHLDVALKHLSSGYDSVLVPADDGGYVLVGLHNHAGEHLFTGIDWGTSQVMAQTRARLGQQGLRWHEFPPLWDIDRPEDLERFAVLMRASYLHDTA
jgi:rSAM/selenodomain-associated transferase 1